jgi:MoxR-like ATPase
MENKRAEAPGGGIPGGREDELIERVERMRERLTREIEHRIVGQRDVVEHLLVALLAGGHVLLVGVPGLAKTLIVKTVADALSLQFGRIQFTPDLMPTDITGTDILEETEGGKRAFRFLKGPLFCNLLLADEINRTPPKTQAALLQAMQERAVTMGGTTFELVRPFIVFATQNPIELSGTYPLPEAQLDRFMMHIDVDYPSAADELEIIRRTTVGELAPVSRLLDAKEILEVQDLVPRVPAADHVLEYAVRLVRRSRPSDPEAPEEIRRYVSWGAGPRAAQMLVLAAKARTLLRGRFAVDLGDVAALAPAVLRHRLVLSFEAEAESIKAKSLIARIIETTPR